MKKEKKKKHRNVIINLLLKIEKNNYVHRTELSEKKSLH